jgi:argininosuccinate synthase
MTVSPEAAPDRATVIDLEFRAGDPVALDGAALTPYEMLAALNTLGGENGIGRLDMWRTALSA